MIEIAEVDSFEKAMHYKGQWNALLQQCESNVIFLTYEFCQSFWEALGEGRELLILLATRGSEVVGIAPLAIVPRRRLGVHTRVVEFLAGPHSDYADMILGPDKEVVLGSFYDHLWSIRERWDMISLPQIPEQSSTVEMSRSHLARSRRSFRILEAIPCPTILLRERAREVLETMGERKTMRKSRKRLQGKGELTFGFAADAQEGLSHLVHHFQQHINRWDHTLTPSLYHQKDERDFYQGLVKSLIPKGWLRLAHLSLDGVPIAICLCSEYADSMSAMKISFDRYYERHSPGKILIEDLVKHCAEKDLIEFDLLAGQEAYKSYDANATRRNYAIHVYRSAAVRARDGFKLWLVHSRLAWPVFRGGKLFDFRMLLRKHRRRYGAWGIVKKMIHRITSLVIEWETLQVYHWCGEELSERSARCPLTIRRGSEADLPLVAGLYGWTNDSPGLEERKQRLNRGDRLYLGLSGKTLVHVRWGTRQRKHVAPEIWGYWGLEEHQAWCFDSFTAFTFRGKGIDPAVFQRMMSDFVAEGAEEVLCATQKTNVASSKAVLKAGFKPQRKERVWKLLGRRLGPETIKVG